MATCPKCGGELPEGGNVCQHCGAVVVKVMTPVAPAAPRRSRRAPLVAVALVIVLAGAAVAAWHFWPGRFPRQNPAELVPASAMVYFDLDLRPNNPSVQQLKPVVDKAESMGLTKKVSGDLERQFAAAGLKLSFKEDIEPWSGGQMGFAVLAPASGMALGMGSPDVVIVLTARDTGRAQQTLERIAGQAPKGPGAPSPETYKQVRLFPLGAGLMSLYGALIERSVVLATPEALKKIVDLSAAAKGDPKSGRLSDSPAYQAVVADLPEQPLARGYVNVASLRQMMIAAANMMTMMTGRKAPNFGAFGQGVDAAGGTMTADAAGVRFDMRSWGAAGNPAAKLASLPAVGGEAARFMPASAFAYVGLPSPAEQWAVMKEQMGSSGPEATKWLGQQLDQLRAVTGLDVEADLLSWMTGEVALAVFDIAPGRLPVQGVLVATARDNLAAAEAVQKILRRFSGLPVQNYTHGGVVLTSVTVPDFAELRPTLGHREQFVLMATTPSAAMKAVDAYADPGSRLVESPDYRQMLGRLGKDPQSIFYANIERALNQLQSRYGSQPGAEKAINVARMFRALGAGGRAATSGQTGTMYISMDYDRLLTSLKEASEKPPMPLPGGPPAGLFPEGRPRP